MSAALSSSSLCALCKKVDINDLLPTCEQVKQPSNPGSYRRWPDGRIERFNPRAAWIPKGEGNSIYMRVDYGTVEEVLGRRGACRMCDFVLKILDRDRGMDFPRNSHVHLSFDIVGRALEEWKVGSKTAWATWSIPRCRFDIYPNPNTGHWHNEQEWQAVAYLTRGRETQPSANSGSRRSNMPTCIGREIPSKCSATLMKSWLNHCRNEHDTKECPPPDNIGQWQPAFKIRLINVKDVCLETFETDRGLPQYVALSYVWGKGPKPHILTKENLASYHKARSLAPVPKTIRDAMVVVRALGERFLWVDAMCIIQDDASDKQAQIPAMGAIYSSALLTIIAASGEDFNAGLSGISSSRPTPSSVSLGKWILLESRSPSLAIRNDPHIGTVWSTRGWTFQEFLLSHRTLTFLKSQAVWRCHYAEYFEEFDIDGLTFEGPFPRQIGPALQGGTSSPGITLESYPMMVHEYLSRELTFEDDIQDAFAGVLQLYDDRTFFWGIPEEQSWIESLAWNLISSPSAVPQQRRKTSFPIPSWSWMAWKEKASIPPCDDGFCHNSYYRLKNGSLQPLGHWRKPVTMADIPLGLVLQPHYLIFRAPVRNLRVGDVREKAGQDCTKQEQGLIRSYVRICKGSYWLEISWNGPVATRHNAVGEVALMEDFWPEISWKEQLIILG